MKKVLVSLMLILAVLCLSLPGMAEGDKVTLEVNTAKLPLHDAADPAIAGLLKAGGEAEGLPVLVLPVRKSLDLKATVMPKSVKNKKVILTAEDDTVIRVGGNRITGLNAGETVVTVASVADPEAQVKYRVLVVKPVSRMSVTAPVKTVAVGETISLSAAIEPADASIREVTWSSADEKLATVDENGNVTGVKRGTARIVAMAKDGSNIRANISIKVTQSVTEITLDKPEMSVAAGKNTVLKATVLPKDADDKKVIWSSSDERIAKVNNQGRVSGVALGDCEIICTSLSNGEVQAKATVHVLQPVKSVKFNDAPVIYAGESGQLSWVIEPADASNQKLDFTSGNKKILQVNADGTVTGLKAGETFVNAMTTDGTNRRARVKVKILQHVEGVHMKRHTAYISRGETATTGAELEPKDASNKNMTWESADPSVATVASVKKQGNRVKITGVSNGDTTVTGTTEEGGFQTSIRVRIGDWDHALKLTEAHVEGADQILTVKNVSDLRITSITAEVTVYDADGNQVPCNSKDGSCTFRMTYRKTLSPGASTREKDWKYVDFKLPDSLTVSTYEVRVTQYQIDGDWVKTIRKKYQPTKKCPVHI